jgi:hypothetical protein
VPGLQVPELVRDDEIARLGVVAAGLQEVGVEDDELAAQEPGGEGVERSAGLHQVGGRGLEAEPLRKSHYALMQFGHLLGAEPHGAAAQVRDESDVRDEEEDAEHRGVDDPDDRDGERDPQAEGGEDDEGQQVALARPALDGDRGRYRAGAGGEARVRVGTAHRCRPPPRPSGGPHSPSWSFCARAPLRVQSLP